MQATIIIIKKLQNTRLPQYIWLVDFSLFLTWMLITDSFSLSLQQATQGFTASTHFFYKNYQSMGQSGWLDGPERCSISNYWHYFFPFSAKLKSDILINFFWTYFLSSDWHIWQSCAIGSSASSRTLGSWGNVNNCTST